MYVVPHTEKQRANTNHEFQGWGSMIETSKLVKQRPVILQLSGHVRKFFSQAEDLKLVLSSNIRSHEEIKHAGGSYIPLMSNIPNEVVPDT